MEEYNSNVVVNGKKIYFRKWKIKDRTKFLTAENDVGKIADSLVYDCLKEKVALSDDEFKFMLVSIREASIETDISYDFDCVCSHEFVYKPKIRDIIKPVFSGYSPITVQNHTFDIGPVLNKEFYDSVMLKADKVSADLFDFLLHVKSYNRNECLDFDQLLDVVNNMDVDVFEKIYLAWNSMKFKINNVAAVECPKCGATQVYEFDDLPDFFPESWNVAE